MRALILEDERPAADRLRAILSELAPDIEIIERLDSVEDSVSYLRRFPRPDLIFMDIQLADGMSFEIFNLVEIKSPVIFTTAFDQYALKAFKINSVDYLLKPIDRDELARALDKYREFHARKEEAPDYRFLIDELQNRTEKKFKKRFLIRHGSKLSYLNTEEVAYFFSQDSSSFLTDRNGNQFILDIPLDELEPQLDAERFFRINRKMII